MNSTEKLRRFAQIYARRELYELHYDNCKVEFSQPHAYGLVYEFLLKGYNTDQIKGAYYHSMIELHSLAVDQGRDKVVPSGLIAWARRRLSSVNPANPQYSRVVKPKIKGAVRH